MMTTSLTIILLFTLLLSFVLIGFSLHHNDRRKVIYFTIVTAATGLYALGYLLEITAPDLNAAITALKIQNLGIPMLAPFFLLLVLTLCHYPVKPWMGCVAFGYGFSLFVCILFNEQHHAYYSEIHRVSLGDLHYLTVGYGPLYRVQQCIVVLCMCAAYFFLLRRMHSWSCNTGRQMRFIALGSLVAFASNLCNYWGLSPHGIDIYPFTCLIALLLLSVSIFRYKLFDIVPVATDYAMQTMEDALLVLNLEGKHLFSNQAAKRLFPELETLAQTDSVSSLAGWPTELSGGPGQFDFTLPAPGGRCSYRARVSVVCRHPDPAPLGWSIVVRDTTEASRLLEQLERLAHTDTLTAVYNRRYFHELVLQQLELAQQHPRQMFMLMFDLDHFKMVNDTYGHLVGDEVLKAVASLVQRELQPCDIFARYGGEEFILFTACMNRTAAEHLAWKLCRSIAKHQVIVGTHSVTVTASFGVVEVHAGAPVEQAYYSVDKALYQAKASGRNQVVCL